MKVFYNKNQVIYSLRYAHTTKEMFRMMSWLVWVAVAIVSAAVLRSQLERRYAGGRSHLRPKRTADWRVIAISAVVCGGSLYRLSMPIITWVHEHAHAIVVTSVIGCIVMLGIVLTFRGFRRNNPHLFERE